MSADIGTPPVNNLSPANRRGYALRTALQLVEAAALGGSPALLTILDNLPENVGKIEAQLTVEDDRD